MIQNEERKVVFVAHCILNQYARAIGVKAIMIPLITPLLRFLMDMRCAIIQMPCPEVEYEGLFRIASGKRRYDTPEYRAICRRIATDVTDLIIKYKDADFKIIILGVDGSPSCGVNFWGRGWMKGKGIFIEELEDLLKNKNVDIPFVGVNIMRIRETIRELSELL